MTFWAFIKRIAIDRRERNARMVLSLDIPAGIQRSASHCRAWTRSRVTSGALTPSDGAIILDAIDDCAARLTAYRHGQTVISHEVTPSYWRQCGYDSRRRDHIGQA
jgi:hypothetical protein